MYRINQKTKWILVCNNTISIFDYCLLDEMRLKIKEVTGFELDTTGSGEQVGLIFINVFSWREIWSNLWCSLGSLKCQYWYSNLVMKYATTGRVGSSIDLIHFRIYVEEWRNKREEVERGESEERGYITTCENEGVDGRGIKVAYTYAIGER